MTTLLEKSTLYQEYDFALRSHMANHMKLRELTQFPLRLAYAVSINKSQGQQYEDILFDTTHQVLHMVTYMLLFRE